MDTKQLTELLADKTGVGHDTSEMLVEEIFRQIAFSVAEGKTVEINNFAALKKIMENEHIGFDIEKKKYMSYPKRESLAFSPASYLNDQIN